MTLLATAFDLQIQPSMLAQQGAEARHQCDPAAAPQLLLVRLPVFEQPGIEPQAAIHEKNMEVHHARLNRLHAGTQQCFGRGLDVLWNAVRTAEIIERALRQHTIGAAAAQHRLRDRIERAVTAGRDHHTFNGLRPFDGLRRSRPDALRRVNGEKLRLPAGRSEDPGQCFRALVGPGLARAGIEHHDQWT